MSKEFSLRTRGPPAQPPNSITGNSMATSSEQPESPLSLDRIPSASTFIPITGTLVAQSSVLSACPVVATSDLQKSTPVVNMSQSAVDIEPNTTCEVEGCSEETFSACHLCFILMCYDHSHKEYGSCIEHNPLLSGQYDNSNYTDHNAPSEDHNAPSEDHNTPSEDHK